MSMPPFLLLLADVLGFDDYAFFGSSFFTGALGIAY